MTYSRQEFLAVALRNPDLFKVRRYPDDTYLVELDAPHQQYLRYTYKEDELILAVFLTQWPGPTWELVGTDPGRKSGQC